MPGQVGPGQLAGVRGRPKGRPLFRCCWMGEVGWPPTAQEEPLCLEGAAGLWDGGVLWGRGGALWGALPAPGGCGGSGAWECAVLAVGALPPVCAAFQFPWRERPCHSRPPATHAPGCPQGRDRPMGWSELVQPPAAHTPTPAPHFSARPGVARSAQLLSCPWPVPALWAPLAGPAQGGARPMRPLGGLEGPGLPQLRL